MAGRGIHQEFKFLLHHTATLVLLHRNHNSASLFGIIFFPVLFHYFETHSLGSFAPVVLEKIFPSGISFNFSDLGKDVDTLVGVERIGSNGRNLDL